MSRPQHVLVAGGGMAGMCSALALAKNGHQVTLLERDDPPPEGDADKAFFEWKRRGASQFRHPHAFLGLMCNLLKDNYPDLLDDLYTAGGRAFGIEDMLPDGLRAGYQPAPGDERLWMLMCRRATVETVLRRYLERQPGIKILNGAIIDGLLLDAESEHPVAKGVRLRADCAEKFGAEIEADIIVDASGRTTKFPGWLAEQGITVPKEEADAEIFYYTRHYRLKEGVAEPDRSGKDRSAGDLGYVKFGVFPGDNRHFALIICLHEAEKELLEAVKDGDKFDAMCRSIPGLNPWVGEDKADATTHPFGHGDIKAQWRHYVVDGKPLVHNFFAVGDAAVRTNPLYGRGCSTGILHAHMLAEVLGAESDPEAQALMFDKMTEQEIRPIYKTSLTEDRNGIRRSLAALEGKKVDEVKGLKKRLIAAFADAAMVAMQNEVHVFRGAMRSLNLLEKPGAFMKDWRTQLIVLRYMFRGRKKNAGARIVRGPQRPEMRALVGIE